MQNQPAPVSRGGVCGGLDFDGFPAGIVEHVERDRLSSGRIKRDRFGSATGGAIGTSVDAFGKM